MSENRIIITKDKDFLDSHILNQKPNKLLLVISGNIKNKEFYTLFKKNFNTIIKLLENNNLVELDVDGISGY